MAAWIEDKKTKPVDKMAPTLKFSKQEIKRPEASGALAKSLTKAKQDQNGNPNQKAHVSWEVMAHSDPAETTKTTNIKAETPRIQDREDYRDGWTGNADKWFRRRHLDAPGGLSTGPSHITVARAQGESVRPAARHSDRSDHALTGRSGSTSSGAAS